MSKKLTVLYIVIVLAVFISPTGLLGICLASVERVGVIERLDNEIVSSLNYYIGWRRVNLELNCGAQVHFKLPRGWSAQKIDGQYTIINESGQSLIQCYENPAHSYYMTDMEENWNLYLCESLGFVFDEIKEDSRLCTNPWPEGNRKVSLLSLCYRSDVVYETVQLKVDRGFVPCLVYMMFLPECNLTIEEQCEIMEAISMDLWYETSNNNTVDGPLS